MRMLYQNEDNGPSGDLFNQRQNTQRQAVGVASPLQRYGPPNRMGMFGRGGRPGGFTPPGPPQGYGGGGRPEGITPPGPHQGGGLFGGDNGNPWFRGDPFQNRPQGGAGRPEGITPPGPPQGYGPQGAPEWKRGGDFGPQGNPWKGDSFQNRPDPRYPMQPEVPNGFGTGPMTWAQQAAMGGAAGPEQAPNWGTYGMAKMNGGGMPQYPLPQESPIFPTAGPDTSIFQRQQAPQMMAPGLANYWKSF